MVKYLKYVLRRIALVLFALGVGLVGWPGDVGAQSLLQFGEIDSTGARRIRIEPKAPAEPEATEEGQGGILGLLKRFGGDGEAQGPEAEAMATTAGAPDAESSADAPVLTSLQELERAADTAPPASEMLVAEFGAKPPSRTPYEVSHAALAAAR